jgi:hypothetical protein
MPYKTVSLYESDEEMVTCENCGNTWDGYAQCYCYGIPEYDSDGDKEQDTDNSRSTHQMTLRSHTSLNATEPAAQPVAEPEAIVEPITHPECWDENTHYGQCGQSCPCCRARVGDEWGACLVCSNK